jgi:hypothetical protein
MRQQLLPIPPENLLPHLRLELNLYGFKILQPALRRDEGVVRAKQKPVLQARGGFAQQSFWNVTW